MSGSNTKDLSERVADLEAWVETVMQLLSGGAGGTRTDQA
jgi:hypothetical protein